VGLSVSEDYLSIAFTVLTQYKQMTDGQTDMSMTAITVLA